MVRVKSGHPEHRLSLRERRSSAPAPNTSKISTNENRTSSSSSKKTSTSTSKTSTRSTSESNKHVSTSETSTRSTRESNKHASTSGTSTRSTSGSNKHGTDAGPRNRIKKRTGYVCYGIRHLHYVLSVSRKTLRDMRQLQKSTRNMLPRLSFQRVVREIMQDFCQRDVQRIQSAALYALQEAAELYLTQLFEDSYFCSLHANRKTLRPVDIQCVRRIRGLNDIINH